MSLPIRVAGTSRRCGASRPISCVEAVEKARPRRAPDAFGIIRQPLPEFRDAPLQDVRLWPEDDSGGFRPAGDSGEFRARALSPDRS